MKVCGHIERAMKGDGHRPRQLRQLAHAGDIDASRWKQDTQHNSVRTGALGDFNVTPHHVELFVRIAEITTSGSNDDMQWEGNSGSDDLQKAEAGSDATLEQVAAEFNPLRPAALRCCSGGEPDCLQGTLVISQLVQSARGRIHITAGGGINAANVAQILGRTGVSEIHVGLATAVPSPMLVRNSRVCLGKAPGREYHRAQVLEESVRELKRAIAQVPANEANG